MGKPKVVHYAETKFELLEGVVACGKEDIWGASLDKLRVTCKKCRDFAEREPEPKQYIKHFPNGMVTCG